MIPISPVRDVWGTEGEVGGGGGAVKGLVFGSSAEKELCYVMETLHNIYTPPPPSSPFRGEEGGNEGIVIRFIS